MAKGISLHIGVNTYNLASYKQLHKVYIPPLPNCHNDANAKNLIANRFGFKPKLLLNQQATLSEVVKHIGAVAKVLVKGDFFFLSFSGHGSRVSDRNGDEDDGYDEAWCLYDQMLVDDDIFALLQQFRPGVRVLIISDSCHSGTVIKDLMDLNKTGGKFPANKTENVLATCLLMAACQDKQCAHAPNNIDLSLYTYWMMNILKEHRFCESYRELHQRISRHMPPSSTPNLFPFGPGADQFIKKKPFAI